MNNYGIFFSYNNQVVRLPVNPAELPVAFESNNETINVLGLGDVTLSRKPKQKAVQIESYFPARADSSVLTRGGFKEPEFYIQFFEAALNEKRILTYTPVRRMENGSAFNVQDDGFKCTVEAFNLTERGGETGDFYYTLLIREWRDYSPQRVEIRNDVMITSPSRSVPAAKIVVGDQVKAYGSGTLIQRSKNPSANTPAAESVSGANGTVIRAVEYDPEDNYDGQPDVSDGGQYYVAIHSKEPGKYEPYYYPNMVYDKSKGEFVPVSEDGNAVMYTLWMTGKALVKDAWNESMYWSGSGAKGSGGTTR